MELLLDRHLYYRVKRGQTLVMVAAVFGVPPRLLASVNRLEGELCAGQVLRLPESCNLYEVKGGESKRLLCGSEEAFREKNGTDCLYPTQIVSL